MMASQKEKNSVAGIAFVDGLIFIGRRLNTGVMGGRWEFPGGKVEDGETLEQALSREFDEEFSLPITIGDKIAEAVFYHNGIKVNLHAFSISFSTEDINWVLTEHTEVNWVKLEQIENLNFVDSDLLLLNQIKSYFQNKVSL